MATTASSYCTMKSQACVEEDGMPFNDPISELTTMLSMLKINDDALLEETKKHEVSSLTESKTILYLRELESCPKYRVPLGEITDYVESNINSLLQVKRKKGLKLSDDESLVKKPKHTIKIPSASTA